MSHSLAVITYMDSCSLSQEKVASLARAVEIGSLRDLQTLLDRKKFALSRDGETGVNLLQKAVALGHMDVARLDRMRGVGSNDFQFLTLLQIPCYQLSQGVGADGQPRPHLPALLGAGKGPQPVSQDAVQCWSG